MYTKEEIDAELASRGLGAERGQQPSMQNNASEMQQANQPEDTGNTSNLFLRGLGDMAAGFGSAGQALHNAPYNITNYFAPETAQKMVKSGFGRLFAPDKTNLSEAFGIKNPNMADNLIQGLSGAIPLAAIGGGPIVGGALSGAVLSQEDPLLGGLVGAGTGAIAKAIPSAINAYKYRPSKVADTIKNMISEEGMAANAEPSKSLYSTVNQATKGQNIYGKPSAKGKLSLENLTAKIPENKITESGIKYKDLNPSRVEKVYTGSKLKLMHNDFLGNPTIENAHTLQSQLGSQIRKLQAKEIVSKSLDAADRKTLDSYLMARRLLQNDIHGFLNTAEGGLADVYKQAGLLHAKDVVPLRNAAALVEKHLQPGEELTMDTLSRALQKMSTKESLARMPLPKELINLGGKLKKGVATQKIIQKYSKPAGYVAAGAIGIPTLKNLISGN